MISTLRLLLLKKVEWDYENTGLTNFTFLLLYGNGALLWFLEWMKILWFKYLQNQKNGNQQIKFADKCTMLLENKSIEIKMCACLKF